MSVPTTTRTSKVVVPTPEPDRQSEAETLIAPPRGWQLIDVAELWRFRELIAMLAWRDIKVRYKQTFLGAAWAVLQPAMMMVVFTIFFNQIAKVPTGKLPSGEPIPYPVFVLAGLLPWTFFAAAVTNASNSVLGSERLITRIYFPRLALPFAAVGAALVDFCFAFGLLLLLMPCFGVWPSWSLLLVPVLFAILMAGAMGVGTALAGLHVAFRDFRYVTPFLITVWMYATPSIYMDTSAVTRGERSWTQAVLALNPLTGLIAGFRSASLGLPMDWAPVGVAAAAALAALCLGCLVFRKVEDNFADVI
jgi:lipopolysaccharide transport system permease protein